MGNENLITILQHYEQEHGLAETLHFFYGSHIHTNMFFSEAMCSMNIDELQLSVRSWNALKRAGISTMGELIDAITHDGLVHIRNLGRISISEIKTKLTVWGYEHLSAARRLQFFEHLASHNQLTKSIFDIFAQETN